MTDSLKRKRAKKAKKPIDMMRLWATARANSPEMKKMQKAFWRDVFKKLSA